MKNKINTYNKHIGSLFSNEELSKLTTDEHLNLVDENGVVVFVFDTLEADKQTLIINDCEFDYELDLPPFLVCNEKKEYPRFWDFKTETEIKAFFVCEGREIKTKFGTTKTFIFALLDKFGLFSEFITVQALPSLKLFFSETENTSSIYILRYNGKRENKDKTATYNDFFITKKTRALSAGFDLSIFK